jgi:hypothetical protein
MGCAHETDPAKAAWLNATSDLTSQQVGSQASNLAIDAASARLVDDCAQRLVLPSPSSGFRPTYLRPTNPTPAAPRAQIRLCILPHLRGFKIFIAQLIR